MAGSANKNRFEFEDGDVLIQAMDQGAKVTGRVSKDAMSRASPVWKKFVTPPWEANSTAGDTKPAKSPISFLEDDPDALCLLLNITHFKFRKVPVKLPYRLFYKVAILCDQYNCVEIVQPWIRGWLKDEDVESQKVGQEGWLFIAWVFGREKVFSKLASDLVRWTFKVSDHLTNSVLDRLPETMPPGIIESISLIRKTTIAQLLEVPREALRKYAKNSVCGKSDGNMECDALVHGSLIRGLQRQNLISESSITITGSVNNLSVALQSIKIFRWESSRSGSHHSDCSELGLDIKVDSIISNISNPVHDSHRAHMAAQKEKLDL